MTTGTTFIFDVDDTLYDQALSFHKTFRRLFDVEVTDEEVDEIYRVSRKYSELLFDQSEAGEISEFEWQTGRIIKACEDFDIPIDSETAATFHEVYVEEQQNISLFEEVEKLLDILYKQGKQLAILTNGETQHQWKKIKQLELSRWVPLDNIFISGSLGYAKPKIEVFNIIEEKLNLDKAKTVYVGDSFEKDIVGAKQAGWKAIWMNHRNKTMPTHDNIKPDKEVFSARELLSACHYPDFVE